MRFICYVKPLAAGVVLRLKTPLTRIMNKLLPLLFYIIPVFNLWAQATGPEVTCWMINSDGTTGYGGIQTNVQQVQYSNANVYVSCTCIPGYDIGPWAGNPNTPANQNFVFKITRNPQENTGTKIATPLGHIGVWTNGVSMFNAKDAFSYQNAGVWNQNAITVEGPSFDDCLGHPAPNGEYHHHLNPTCLYYDADASQHSPIIGYAFDGYPVYGAFAYSGTDGSGGYRRMETSYRLRNITTRTTLPDGTALNANQYGPAVSQQYRLGYYIEDYEYVQGLGDLDEHNGRFAVTPEYPNGTYAYYITLDSNLMGVYPYTLGPAYYGTVAPGNTGPQSGHNTPVEPVVTYVPTGTGIADATSANISLYPNPAKDFIQIDLGKAGQAYTVKIFDAKGVLMNESSAAESIVRVDATHFSSGMYLVQIISAKGSIYQSKILKQ